jgi:prophage regulatory protein
VDFQVEQDNEAYKSTPRKMLDEEQVLQIVPVSRTTLFRLEKRGGFPRSTYISPNRRIWYEDEIAAWQRSVDERDPRRGAKAVAPIFQVTRPDRYETRAYRGLPFRAGPFLFGEYRLTDCVLYGFHD